MKGSHSAKSAVSEFETPTTTQLPFTLVTTALTAPELAAEVVLAVAAVMMAPLPFIVIITVVVCALVVAPFMAFVRKKAKEPFFSGIPVRLNVVVTLALGCPELELFWKRKALAAVVTVTVEFVVFVVA